MRVKMLAIALGVAAVGLTGGCVPLRSHQGYVIDADLVNSVQPGVDTRTSVLQTLGRPTLTSQFTTGDWYYLARDSRNFAYKLPKAKSQVTLKISFNDKDVVTSITRMGTDQIAKVDMYGKKTPTLGRKRTFLEDLFGNIGAVGAGGTGPGGGGNTGP